MCSSEGSPKEIFLSHRHIQLPCLSHIKTLLVTERMSDEMKSGFIPFKAVLCWKMLTEVLGWACGFLFSDTELFGCKCKPRHRGKYCLTAAAVHAVCPIHRSMKMKHASHRSDGAYGEY